MLEAPSGAGHSGDSDGGRCPFAMALLKYYWGIFARQNQWHTPQFHGKMVNTLPSTYLYTCLCIHIPKGIYTSMDVYTEIKTSASISMRMRQWGGPPYILIHYLIHSPYIGSIHSPMTHHLHCFDALQWARISCALKQFVTACPRDSLDAHHLLCSVIKLGICHRTKKERNNPLLLCFGCCSPLVQWDLNSCTQLHNVCSLHIVSMN